MKILSKNFLLLLVTLIVAFLVNYFVLVNWDDRAFPQLSLTYSVNYLLTIVIILGLYFVSKKSNKYLGFAFLFSSFFKFMIFFAAIRPNFQLGGMEKSMTFVTFFVPYAICLLFEVLILLRLLKSQG